MASRTTPPKQPELPFAEGAAGGDGLERWREERRRRLDLLAKANGLPLGQRCRIELLDGRSLEGLLLLAESAWVLQGDPRHADLPLAVGPDRFRVRDIASLCRIT